MVARRRIAVYASPMNHGSTASPERRSAPLLLLVRVNSLQAWRRLKSIRDQSRLLTSIIVLFMAGYWALSFWLFLRGLQFVAGFLALGTVLTERLMYLLFAFLFALLLLSNVVIGYTNFFRNREAAFLTSLPVTAHTIFRWKFIESVLLASWAFIFLIAPLLAAFGLTQGVAWHFYPATVVLIAMFIVLPGVAGAWLALNLGRHLDRRSFQIAAVVVMTALLVLARFWWRSNPVTEETLDIRVLGALDQLLQKTRFAQFPFLPSYWLTSSVLQWAEGVPSLALFFALVLLSNVLFFGLLAFTQFGELYYDGVSCVNSRAGVWGQWQWFRARQPKAFNYPVGAAEQIVARLSWLDAPTRALLVKDARMFWRDTTQWGQSVLLVGLLGVYLINLRQFTGQLVSPYWLHLTAYLNLGACSLNLAMLTTRFVYPQFSLEGQRLWIVGLAPMGLARVVRVKFWLAACTSLAMCLSLIILSCRLLKLDWGQVAFFSAVITVMAFTLNALATGMGVLYPNFKESNPSKIVSGFGGTFCFVLSFLYILVSILLLSLGSAGTPHHAPSMWFAVASLAAFLTLSLLLGSLPLKFSLRRLRHFEF
jgi:ABC-2 type transport system permease protein